MRYEAKIENGIVTDVVVMEDNFTNPLDGDWIVYTENDEVGIGYTYSEIEGFRPPKPFESWLWNNNIKSWEAPTPLPDEDNIYEWNEVTQSWVMVYMKV